MIFILNPLIQMILDQFCSKQILAKNYDSPLCLDTLHRKNIIKYGVDNLSYKQIMSLKLLCFGESTFLSQVISKLRSEQKPESDEEVVVDNLEIRGRNFIAFSILNTDLIGTQATGTGALLFFLDANQPLYQQKQLFYGIIGERREFEGLPVVIAYDKDQNLQIKEIVNYFELYKAKDRASMIKEIDIDDIETTFEIFSWIDGQVQFRKTKTFDAAPKVVKVKPKYRESEPETTQKKYQGIVRDKKFRGAGVKGQEQAYIEKEKERIKNENMEKQLANFNKNKKKMAPYDIKATPNPKIQANLHFFLKDPRVDKNQQVNIKIQTDEFKEKPKPKPYVPKKTGINAATQIEPTQLFDFDKEVQPILDILTTRALQTAALQIEQEEESLKIAKYKNAYTERVKKQKKHESENIQIEKDAIKEKERILQIARKKDATKRNITKKQSYYSIANNFLEGVYKNAAVGLYKKNFYPNQFEHSLKTEYLPQVLQKALVSYEKILKKQQCIKGVFEEPCLKPVKQMAENPKEKHAELRAQKEKRRLNKGQKARYVHILFNLPQDSKFSSFSKYFSKEMEGTLDEYVKARQEEIQQAEDKVQTEELDEAGAARIKEKDNVEYAEGHRTLMIDGQKQLCFSIAQNKYEKCVNTDVVTPGALFFDLDGKLLQNSIFQRQSTLVRSVNGLRYYRDPFGVDNGLVINLDSIPDHVRSIVPYLEIKNVGKYAQQNQAKKIKSAVYQLEFYEKAIPIFKEEIGSQIKTEEFAKPQDAEGGEQAKQVASPENVVIWAYHLRRKNKDFWQVEEMKQISKPFEDEKADEFFGKISNFYKQSLEIFKSDEEEPRVEKGVASRERGSKKKSRKMLSQKQIIPSKSQIKVTSRVLREVTIPLDSEWQKMEELLRDEVVDWKQFIESAPDGWCLQFRGKKLQNSDQLKKYNKVGDILLKKIDPPPVQKQAENVQGEEEPQDDN